MAKKWKAYPWADRGGEDKAPPPPAEDEEEEEEEIDVVGESPAASALPPPGNPSPCWGPSSPTAGATAPSPPPHATATAATPDYGSGTNSRVTVLYNGKCNFVIERFVMQEGSASLNNMQPTTTTTTTIRILISCYAENLAKIFCFRYA
jgi:hypothetical protein